jgi:hypothetical protein
MPPARCSAGTWARRWRWPSALGVNTLITAELLPEIEAVMVRKLNEQMEGGRDG